MADNARVKVLEVDQWTSTGNVGGTRLSDWETDRGKMLCLLTGGDAPAIRSLGLNHAVVREVYESSEPSMGNVWFKPDENGVLKSWKYNYDSSG